MKLLRLHLENFRGAPNGAYSFVHPSTGAPVDTVLITGPASSGKTSFLAAIAALKESVGAWGVPPDAARLIRRGATTGIVEGTWLLTASEVERAEAKQATVVTRFELGEGAPLPELNVGLRDLFSAYDHDPNHGKFEYFPSTRRLASHAGEKARDLAGEARLRLGTSPTKYASIKRSLVDLALRDGVKTLEESASRGVLFRSDQRDSLLPYRRDLAALLPHLRLLGVELDGDAPELWFERDDGARLLLDDLSDSEQQAVLFVATFRRIGLSHSIVLVDQPELGLHADAQLGFVRAVEGLGVDNQLFFATGSLEITRTAAPHQLVRLGGPKT
ncbi:MAG: AAA family ATPase [Byssovorax sp.]